MERAVVVSFHDLAACLRGLEPDRARPVIVHASLSAFGQVAGGAETVTGALLASFDTVVAPTFTYKAMLTPQTGPEDNGLTYGGETNLNKMAEFFTPGMKADRMMGIIPETLRRHPQAKRSIHPILSFAGVNAADILAAQTIAEPLAVIGKLYDAAGMVLLLGVGQTVNTSIHYGERMAKRKQFVRWAMTPDGVIECPGFPGCSDGFDGLEPEVEKFTRRTQIGGAVVMALPVRELVDTVRITLAKNPQAGLCYRTDCERCNAARQAMVPNI